MTTFIYQSLIGKTDLKWAREINKFDKNIPDLTLVFKISLNELLKRSQIEKRDFDKFETPEYLDKETKIIYNLPKDFVKEFNVEYLEAEGDPENTVERCVQRIQKEIDKKF